MTRRVCFLLILASGLSSGRVLGDDKPAVKRADATWWSLQPIRRPAVPTPGDAAWRANPIDAFIKAKLDERQLVPNPEADRRTYMRRVTLDLTGLLPTPGEVDEFLKMSAGDPREADKKLVDRLLGSDAYGERWGRHWLDVVRFAESHGYEMNTLRPNAWHYRDYVIRAFNRDTPFPQFILEQLAGDTLTDADQLSQAGTGFLVAGPHDLVGNATLEGKLQQRSDDLFDMTATTASVFLGLTVGCARCHDHKFDPISQRDFYRMQAMFAGVEHADRPLVARGGSAQQKEMLAKFREEIDAVEKKLEATEPLARLEGDVAVRPSVNAQRNSERIAPVEARFIRFTITATNDGTQPCLDELEVFSADERSTNLAREGKATASSEFPNNAIHKISHLNDGELGNSHSWIANTRSKGWAKIELPKPARIERIVWGRDRDGRYQDRLAVAYEIETSLDDVEWHRVAGSRDRAKVGTAWKDPAPGRAKLLAELGSLKDKLTNLEKASIAYAGNFRRPNPTHLLNRGDVLQKGDEVGPASISGIGYAFSITKEASDAERRRGLAEWLAHPANPLPARVMANRVWHYHFGQGIVNTPSDFGFNGGRPSHPELLDWLAAEFQANGGKLKPLHRLIVLSKTYRQSSRIDPDKAKQDGGNRVLARFPSRRLEAEAIRDTILQTSGALDRRMGGPGYHLWTYTGYVIVFAPKPKLGPDEFRRMVYQFKPRLQQDNTFGAFDCPDGTGVAPRRTVSTTALQALNLLNDPFLHDQAERFADRLKKEAAGSTGEQVRRAFMLAFAREPSEKEAKAAIGLVEEHGLATLCRALFNANEFVMLE